MVLPRARRLVAVLTWHRSEHPALPGRALIWPSPRRCLTRWHDGTYAITFESGVTFSGLTEAQARRYLDSVPWPADEDAAWCWGN